MLDKFFYENNNGKRVVFGEGGLYANYNDLRDYEWSYSDDNNIIGGFYKEPVKKSLPVVIVKNSLAERIAVRNSLFEVFESDISTVRRKDYIFCHAQSGERNVLVCCGERKVF